MNFDYSSYLKKVLSSLDDTIDKYYVDTTSGYSPEDVAASGKSEYVSTVSQLIKNLSANKNTLLLGNPGSGKSTALKRLLHCEAQDYLDGVSRRIPVLLELRRVGGQSSFDGENITLFKLIHSKLSVSGFYDKSQINQLLESGKLLLLLDGFNEMPSTSSGLNDFIKDHPNSPVVISSRVYGHENHLDVDCTLHLQPLQEYQSREFIKKRFIGSTESTGELLNLRQDKLQELLETPLFLSMLCDTYQLIGSVPKNIGELFRRFTNSEYMKHKPSTTVVASSDDFFDFCHEILQELAFSMTHAGGDGQSLRLQISKVEAQAWLEMQFSARGVINAASKAKQWLDDAIKLHLLQQADDENVEFIHQLFQEYYAAEWLLRHFEDLTDDQIGAHYFNPIKWTESIFILVGLLSDEARVLDIIELATSVDLKFATKLSGKVRPEFQAVAFDYIKRHLQNEIADESTFFSMLKYNESEPWANFIIGYLRSDSQKKMHIVDWLDHSKSLSVINYQSTGEYYRSILNINSRSKHLDDRDKVGEALAVLSKFGDVEAIISLALSDTATPLNAGRAANFLADVRNEQHVSLLADYMDKEAARNQSCFWAIYALGEINNEEASNKLIEVLKSEKFESNDRGSAANALRESSNPRAMPAVLSALISDGECVEPAAYLIKRVNYSHGEQWLLAELSKRTSFAQWILYKITASNKSVADDLLLWLTKNTFIETDKYDFQLEFEQQRLISALGFIGSEQAVPLIKSHFQNNDWQVRCTCAEALGRIASKGVSRFLLKALENNRYKVRSANFSGRKSENVRRSLISALGRITDPAIVKVFFAQISSQTGDGHGIYHDLVIRMQHEENYNLELVIGAFNSDSKEIIKSTMGVLWLGSDGLEQTDRLVKSMAGCMNRLDGEMGERMCSFLCNGSHGFKSPEIDLAVEKFNQSRTQKVKPYTSRKKRNKFEKSHDINTLFEVLHDSQDSGSDENSWENKHDALKRIKQIAKIDDLPRLLDYCQTHGNLNALNDVQKRHGFYNAAWLLKSSKLPFFSSKYEIGSTTNMTDIYNFNDKVIGSMFGSKHGTINNTATNLNPSDESELRNFLQSWIEQQKGEIIDDPEASGAKAAQALEVQNPNIVGTLQNSSIGAVTSLVGDLATGEEPIKAFIKAFLAFIGGIAAG